MDVALLLLVYFLALSSGVAVATRVELPSLLARVVVALAWGSAQLLFVIQVLSLCHQLRQAPLLAANALVAVLTLVVSRPFRAGALQVWRIVLPKGFAIWVRDNLLVVALLGGALSSVLLLTVLQTQLIPTGDTYHYSMPLYWKQHASLLPFPTANPRNTGLSFASEAIAFPAVLFVKTWAVYGVLAVLARLLIVWVVIAIARRLGASLAASLYAGAICVGYPSIGMAATDMLMATMWFAAAIFLLVEASRAENSFHWCLGFSLLCLLLGCGSKNIIALQAPLYLLFAFSLFGRRLFDWASLRSLILAGVLGLVCSTTLWTYATNRLWFGDSRGPVMLRETLAADFRFSSVWTRVIRGTVGAFSDPTWLPRSVRTSYGTGLQEAVRFLGARKSLVEDSEYYSFIGESLRPGSGLGPLGLVVLAPSLVIGLTAARRTIGRTGDPSYGLGLALALLTISSFLICFALLRTQRIGLMRLMGSSVVVGAPLAACLFAKSWIRFITAAVLCLVLVSFAVVSLGAVARRSGAAHPSWLTSQISRLQNNHTQTLSYQWSDGPLSQLTIREDFSMRELYELLLTRVPPHSVCAFMGIFNSSEIYLFGSDFSNTVISLQDARVPEQVSSVPATVEYIVSETGDFPGLDYESNSFQPWLVIWREGKPAFAALKRTR